MILVLRLHPGILFLFLLPHQHTLLLFSRHFLFLIDTTQELTAPGFTV
jgi:hypothetical protein